MDQRGRELYIVSKHWQNWSRKWCDRMACCYFRDWSSVSTLTEQRLSERGQLWQVNFMRSFDIWINIEEFTTSGTSCLKRRQSLILAPYICWNNVVSAHTVWWLWPQNPCLYPSVSYLNLPWRFHGHIDFHSSAGNYFVSLQGHMPQRSDLAQLLWLKSYHKTSNKSILK